MAAEDEGNFFSRWSRRKVQVRTGQPLPTDPPLAPAPPAAHLAVPPGTQRSPGSGVAGAVVAPDVQAPGETPEPKPEAPPLTLDDVARLTTDGDFKPFMARQVPAEVRNAAVKKLFTDPHFNVMDGLDIYIDDYSKPSPLSAADMAQMVSAQFLKLVDDPNEVKKAPPAPVTAERADDPDRPTEPEDAPVTDASAHTADGAQDEPPAEAAATPPTTEPHDDHADLQLQPDHAPESESPGRGTG